MKIVHVSPTYDPVLGGAELYMKELSQGLASRGHNVTVLTLNVTSTADLFLGVRDALPETQMDGGVNIVRFDPNGKVPGWWVRKWLALPGGWRSLKPAFGEDGLEILNIRPQPLQLIPYVVRARADIVMAMNWHWSPAYYTHLARRLRKFALVGVPHFHTWERWSQRPIYKAMLARTDAVVAMTEHEEGFMRAHGASRVEVVGAGVHPLLFALRNGAAIRERYAIGSAPVVGFIGRQGANKGVHQLVDAMRIVWQWNPEVRLMLAGHRSTEHQDSQVGAAIDRLSPSEHGRLIRISQFEDKEKASFYDAFDVFALPSTGESFGISYLEAWMCQKPVIGARIGSTECVIDDGVDGLLVDPADPKDIAEKIIDLLSDRDKREAMGRRGHAKTLARYTWDKVVDKVEALYHDLHGARDSPGVRQAVPVGRRLETDG